MRIIIVLLLSLFNVDAAIYFRAAQNDFQTTKRTPNYQTAVFANATNEVTIALWVNHHWSDAVYNSMVGTKPYQGLIGKGGWGSQGGILADLQFGLGSTNETLRFGFASPANAMHIWETSSSYVTPTNVWKHVAVTFVYNNAASIAFYVNGVIVSGSWTSGTGNSLGRTNALSFHTAVSEYPNLIDTSHFFGGTMSELCIWTNALTAGEVNKLYKCRVKGMPLQIRPSSILLYLPMDTQRFGTGLSPNDSNLDVDRGPWHFNMDAGGTFLGERVCSYQPNE